MELIRFDNGLKLYDTDIIFGELQIGEDDLDLDPHRSTKGRLYRNRVNIVPSIEFTLKPMNQSKMGDIMDAIRPQDFWVEYYDLEKDSWYRAEFYVPSDYRKPRPLRLNPSIIFDNHELKFIGIDKAVKL